MTDFLAEAENSIGQAKYSNDVDARGCILNALESIVAHLRSTPTEPARTEEKPRPFVESDIDMSGVPECDCTPLPDRGHGPGCSWVNEVARRMTERQEAEGSEGPSESVAVEIEYDHGDEVTGPFWVYRPVGSKSWSNTGSLGAAMHFAREEHPGCELRAKIDAGSPLPMLYDGNPSADRELTELRIDLAQQESLAHGYTSELAELADTLTQLRAALQCGPGDELTQVRAAKRHIEEQERELAELREKVRHWEPVVSCASGYKTRETDGALIFYYGAIPAHLRPGSGSDEGKA